MQDFKFRADDVTAMCQCAPALHQCAPRLHCSCSVHFAPELSVQVACGRCHPTIHLHFSASIWLLPIVSWLHALSCLQNPLNADETRGIGAVLLGQLTALTLQAPRATQEVCCSSFETVSINTVVARLHACHHSAILDIDGLYNVLMML